MSTILPFSCCFVDMTECIIIEAAAMENHFDDKQLKMFLHQMTKREVGCKMLLTGSFAEIGKDDFLDLPSDIDLMCSMSNIHGMEVEDDEKDAVPKSFKGRLIKHSLNHPDCHPGFSRIESRDHAFIGKLFTDGSVFVKGNGPAMKLGNIWKHDLFLFEETEDPADIVFCIPCNGWPSTASAWKTRHRISDWPSEDLIRAAVAGGYHLVDKPHPRHPENGHFLRISFSRSECLLMSSLNEVQKRVYALLRKMKKLIVRNNSKREHVAHGSVLSTYFFKTAMLWLCEERPKEFWEYENVPIAVKEILVKLLVWFVEKNCPNYFIPENNMLDHLLDDDVDLERDIASLAQFAEYDWPELETQLLVIHYGQKPIGCDFIVTRAKGKALKATCDLKREVPSLLQLYEFELSPLRISMDSKDVALQLFSIADVTHASIKTMMGRLSDVFECTAEIQPLSSENRSHHRNTTLDRLAIFKPASDDVRALSVLYRFLCQWDLDTTGNSVDSIVSECHVPSTGTHRNKMDDIELLQIIGDLSSAGGHCLFESKSRTDAINISLTNVKSGQIFGVRRTAFVICSYLANYYYVVEKDYSSAMLLSSTLIDACTSDICYIAFSELSFPILLSSRWSKLFDDNFRTVYGFLVLIFNSISRHKNHYSSKLIDTQPTVKFCSVLFLRYLKVQLELKCGDDAKAEREVRDFFWHLENRCPVDGHIWTVTDELFRRILLAVLRSSLAASNKLWMLENRNHATLNIQKNELLPTSISLRVLHSLLCFP